MKIQLVVLGKIRRAEVRSLFEDYVARIGHYAEVGVSEFREESPTRFHKLKFEPGARIVLLDAAGRQYSSEQFARWLGELRERGVRELVFFCGGADGFPEELCNQAPEKISLSTLTMPHELARVVLAEQIYRGFAILAGHPYPK